MTGRTIIRAEHGEQPYFMLLRTVAQNTALSYEALGLLVYLLSKPNDWQVHPSTLTRERTGGAHLVKEQTMLHRIGVRSKMGVFVLYHSPYTNAPVSRGKRLTGANHSRIGGANNG